MNLNDPELRRIFDEFNLSVEEDQEYLAIMQELINSGVGIPVIVCSSQDEIDKPDPSSESRQKSLQLATKNYLFIKRFFPVEGKYPVVLDKERNLIYPTK